MRRAASLSLSLVFMLVLGLLADGPRGEISVETGGALPQVIYIFGKEIGPDPWPSFGVVRPISIERILNPDGDIQGDRRPDLFQRAGFPPSVVWSRWDGSDFEIAYSEWNGSGWTAPLLLTSNTVDDLDPRIVQDLSGTPVVTWWRSGGTVYTRRRTQSGFWEAESAVSAGGEVARMPVTGIGPDSRTRFAYETIGNQRTVIVTRDDRPAPEATPVYTREIVATTPYQGQVRPELSEKAGLTYVTWIHSDIQAGWSELRDGAWTVPAFEPYSGPDDVEAARFRIRNRLQP